MWNSQRALVVQNAGGILIIPVEVNASTADLI